MACPTMAACAVAPAYASPRAFFLQRPCIPFANRIKHAVIGNTKDLQLQKLGPNAGHRVMMTSWFKFGKNGLDAEGAGIYGSQGRDDFDKDDVEQYFNYMGMLATEGTYEKMDALLNTGIHPVDILLLLAAAEGDKPKIEELLRAGAVCTVKDAEGRTALDRAQDDELKEFILNFSKAAV